MILVVIVRVVLEARDAKKRLIFAQLLVVSMEHVLINYSDTNAFVNLDGQETCVTLVLMIVKIILAPMVIFFSQKNNCPETLSGDFVRRLV